MTSIRLAATVAVLAAVAAPAAAQIRTIVTNPQGSLGYSTGVAIAKVMSDKTDVNIRVQPAGGSSTYIPMINRGEHDFGFANVAETEWAMKGEDAFKGRPNPDIRLVVVTYPISIGFAVPNNSPAKSLTELKGKRLPSQYTAQSIFRALSDSILAAEGLKNADFQAVPVNNYVAAMKLLGDRKLDVALTGVGTAIEQETHAQLASSGGLRYLSMPNTPEAVAAMRKHIPGGYVATIAPAKNKPGVRGPVGAMTYSNFMITGKHVPEDVVYKLVKAMHQNPKQLGDNYAPMRGFDVARMNEAHPVEYHPGAVRYFKEVNQWPPKAR